MKCIHIIGQLWQRKKQCWWIRMLKGRWLNVRKQQALWKFRGHDVPFFDSRSCKFYFCPPTPIYNCTILMKPTFSKYLFNNYKMTCNLVAGNCEGCRNDRTPGVCGQVQMMFMKQWVQCVDYFIGGENGRKTEDWRAWDSDQQVLEYQIYVRTLFFGKHRLMIFFLLMWKESDQSCFCLLIHIFFVLLISFFRQ